MIMHKYIKILGIEDYNFWSRCFDALAVEKDMAMQD